MRSRAFAAFLRSRSELPRDGGVEPIRPELLAVDFERVLALLSGVVPGLPTRASTLLELLLLSREEANRSGDAARCGEAARFGETARVGEFGRSMPTRDFRISPLFPPPAARSRERSVSVIELPRDDALFGLLAFAAACATPSASAAKVCVTKRVE